MIEENLPNELVSIHKEKGDGAYWANASFRIEKIRLSSQRRVSHLGKTGRRSPDTEMFVEMVETIEKYVDGRLAEYITNHPTWPWASRIKGIGKENYPKVIGLIEAFGTRYDVGSPNIPPFVTREPEAYQVIVEGKVVDKVGVWVEGIERLSLPSKLWKYCGLDVDATGKAAKAQAGKAVSYNTELKAALYRLEVALLRAGAPGTKNKKPGIWYSGGDRNDGYSRGYEGHRRVIQSMKESAGFKIVPTPKARMCFNCDLEISKKKTLWCPECGGKLSLKSEPPGVLYLGHLHQMAMRRMIKDFVLCVWLVWRQALDLPTPNAYDVVRLGEPPIDPWKMVDKPECMRKPE